MSFEIVAYRTKFLSGSGLRHAVASQNSDEAGVLGVGDRKETAREVGQSHVNRRAVLQARRDHRLRSFAKPKQGIDRPRCGLFALKMRVSGRELLRRSMWSCLNTCVAYKDISRP
jgi:hypothetical protein